MKLKKVLALTMVATMAVGAFVGCGNSKDGGDSAKSDSGKVYYLTRSRRCVAGFGKGIHQGDRC